MLLRQRRADRLGSTRPSKVDDRAAWTRLEPVRRLDASEQNDLPALDIVSICKVDTPGLVANHGHAFIRLIDAEGGVCPIGFFPDESTAIEPDLYPGLRMPGMLLLPDKYDRIDWNVRTTRIPLSASGHMALRHAIESLQAGRKTGTLRFDLLDRSCVGFVVRMAAWAGIRVEAEVHIADFMGVSGHDRVLDRVLRRLARGLPQSLYRLVMNGYIGLNGAFCSYDRIWRRMPDGETQLEEISGIEPVFASWREALSRRVSFYHVHGLRRWQAEIAARGLDPFHLAGPVHSIRAFAAADIPGQGPATRAAR